MSGPGLVKPPAGLGPLISRSDLHVVVIGGGGWMGLATLDLLFGLLGPSRFEQQVTVLGSSERVLEVRPGISVFVRSLLGSRNMARPSDERLLVVHNAFLTRDKVAAMAASDYLDQNRAISGAVADLMRRWGPQGLFLPSSGAVYGPDGALETRADVNPYGWLKAEDEALFGEITEAIGAHYIVPRIFGLSGEYINKVDTYALASIILQLLESDQVVLRATRPVYRSYVYVGDLMALGLALMVGEARRVEVFDTAGAEVVEVEALARLAREALGRPDAAIQRTLASGLEPDRYVGDGARLEALSLDLEAPLMPLREQIVRTAAFLSAS